MFGFQWNGTLTRIAVGGTQILLVLTYSESRFWLELLSGLAQQSGSYGDPLIFAVFVCIAYALGTVFTELLPRQERWEALIAEAIASDSKEMLSIVSESRTRTELYFGLSRSFALFAGLGVYNMILRASGISAGPESGTFVGLGYVALIPSILFAVVTAWALSRYGNTPLEMCERILKALKQKQKT